MYTGLRSIFNLRYFSYIQPISLSSLIGKSNNTKEKWKQSTYFIEKFVELLGISHLTIEDQMFIYLNDLRNMFFAEKLEINRYKYVIMNKL